MPSSGDAHIDFTEEVTPDKGSLNKLAKTFIPFILLFLTKAGYQLSCPFHKVWRAPKIYKIVESLDFTEGHESVL